MPIPASGPINMSDLRAVFGGSEPDGLSEYYKGGSFVTANATNANVPTSGNPISFSNFRSVSGASNRNVNFSMRYDPGPDRFSGVGLAATDSVTGTPYSYSANSSGDPNTLANYNPYYYQPVFRAGTGYIVQLSFGVHQNEDNDYTIPIVQFLGGTDSSNVTDLIFAWKAYRNPHTGGGYDYVLEFNGDGSINNTSYTNGFSSITQYIFHTTELYYSNINSNHRWYRFAARSPYRIGKQGLMMRMYTTLTALPQPT